MQLLYADKDLLVLRQEISATEVSKRKSYTFGLWNVAAGQNGLGIVYMPGHFYFEGQLRNGFPQGSGKVAYPGSDTFVGKFSAGEAVGHGKFASLLRGFSFEGSWNKGRPLAGTFTFDQARQALQFSRSSSADPIYTIVYPDATRYVGQLTLLDGQLTLDGHGAIRYPDGSAYEGQWKNGKMHGQGVFRWANGTRYEGEYNDGLKHGEGKYYWNGQAYYQGGWARGLRQGKGAVYHKGKLLKTSCWAADKDLCAITLDG